MEARWVRYALFVLLAFPAFLPFNFVYRFGVNSLHWDQWEFVPALVRFFDGELRLSDLTSQHNEHRLFFPRLIMLGLAALTRYDNRAEMYFNAALLVAIGAVLLRAHVRSFGASNRSLFAFLPVPWLLFTWRQYENLLWGWQLQITLCALGCVGSLWLLDGVKGLGRRWLGATAAAIVATFSFGSGITIWPVGVLLMLWQGRRDGSIPWRAIGAWLAVAAVAGVMFTWNFQRPGLTPSPLYFLQDPQGSSQFLLAILGSVATDHLATSAAFGAMLLAACGVLFLERRRQRLEPGPTTFALGLILFAGASALLVLLGRAGFGKDFGLTSRYITLTMFGFIGLHRAVLALKEPTHRGLLMGILLAATVASVFSSFTSGLSSGFGSRSHHRRNREILLSLDKRPDEEVALLYVHVHEVRKRTEDLKRLGLNVFTPKK
ncbi:MAG TPA: hypothetical protein VF815_08635 [Myxococcaceae bacterium]|jgi:hypothetical protein